MQINAKTLGFKYGDRILVYVCTNAEWYTSRLMWFYSNNKIRRNKNLKFLPKKKLQARSIYFCFFNFAKKGERKKDVDDVLAIVTAVAAQMLRIAKKKKEIIEHFYSAYVEHLCTHVFHLFFWVPFLYLHICCLLTLILSIVPIEIVKKKEKNHCSIYVDEIDTIIMMIISHIT